MWERVEMDAAFSVYHCVHASDIIILKVFWHLEFSLNQPSVRREGQIPDCLNHVLPIKTIDT